MFKMASTFGLLMFLRLTILLCVVKMGISVTTIQMTAEPNNTVSIGVTITLTCRVNARALPVLTVKWFHNDVSVFGYRPTAKEALDKYRRDNPTPGTWRLIILSAQPEESGVWRCESELRPSLRTARSHMELWIGVTPGAPMNVRAGSSSHDTVILLIDSPTETGGLALTYFRVKYRNIGVLRWEVIDFPIGKNTIIVGLRPNMEYLFKVAAGNPVGFGNYSEVVRIPTVSQYSPSRDPTTDPSINGTRQDGVWPRHNDSWWDSTNPTDDDEPGLGSFGPSPFAIVIGVVVAVFLTGVILFIMLALYCVKWHKKRPTEEQRLCRNRPNSYIFSDTALFQFRQDSVQYDVMPNGPGLLRGEFEFPRYALVLGGVLGTGSFGKVVRGEAEGILRHGVNSVVAIKMLKENATPTDHQDLLKELGVMKILKPHPNIVTLFGCCTMEEPPLIIMEYLPNGNLLQHLRSSRQRVEDIQTHRTSIRTALSPTDLIRYAYEIANGMTYLASMMCIHRDLAARNILLSHDGVCKLSDFGLARDVVNGGIYQRKTQGRVPIRWMALESLLDNVYTIQSDVWSFAVLLWEIVTIGSYPFPGMSSKKLIKELQRGYRMQRPDHCSGDVYDMMLDCWRENPEDRPTFENLRNRLEAILIESRNYLVLDFDEQLYDYTYTGSTDPIDV